MTANVSKTVQNPRQEIISFYVLKRPDWKYLLFPYKKKEYVTTYNKVFVNK